MLFLAAVVVLVFGLLPAVLVLDLVPPPLLPVEPDFGLLLEPEVDAVLPLPPPPLLDLGLLLEEPDVDAVPPPLPLDLGLLLLGLGPGLVETMRAGGGGGGGTDLFGSGRRGGGAEVTFFTGVGSGCRAETAPSWEERQSL